MKTNYKHLVFKYGTVTKRWVCRNKEGLILGAVEYYNGWRQFVFESTGRSIILSASCLIDIADFLSQLNKTKGCYKEKK